MQRSHCQKGKQGKVIIDCCIRLFCTTERYPAAVSLRNVSPIDSKSSHDSCYRLVQFHLLLSLAYKYTYNSFMCINVFGPYCMQSENTVYIIRCLICRFSRKSKYAFCTADLILISMIQAWYPWTCVRNLSCLLCIYTTKRISCLLHCMSLQDYVPLIKKETSCYVHYINKRLDGRAYLKVLIKIEHCCKALHTSKWWTVEDSKIDRLIWQHVP
jgi:hypothetical protein